MLIGYIITSTRAILYACLQPNLPASIIRTCQVLIWPALTIPPKYRRLQHKLATTTTVTPEYQLPFTQTSKTKFKRSYDLYSLGVVLIEIGLWKQIDSFRPEGSHALAFKRHLEETVAPALKFYMGEKYTLAAQLLGYIQNCP
ncbi:hypothetical protein FVEG_09950 [Fusarium verticillioides 7600]|uniref:Protein kinase domain-containing protein n=1 Tax=Gibberella moniliformis (strain M3125 / FGSC 7600) TaxID=334819 RepID=W7MT05_GIBM7|nr:hypothetical protein FVEG_09950 [Fusarium verticillioides 7600]EWG50820.1 hypothetical protein FVEG_09950 [Fusarium verticillioides 7600]